MKSCNAAALAGVRRPRRPSLLRTSYTLRQSSLRRVKHHGLERRPPASIISRLPPSKPMPRKSARLAFLFPFPDKFCLNLDLGARWSGESNSRSEEAEVWGLARKRSVMAPPFRHLAGVLIGYSSQWVGTCTTSRGPTASRRRGGAFWKGYSSCPFARRRREIVDSIYCK